MICSNGHSTENLYLWNKRKYCRACAAMRARIRRALGPRKIISKKCAAKHCDLTFEVEPYNKKYCSDTCKNRQNHRDYLSRHPGYQNALMRKWRKEHPGYYATYEARKLSLDPLWKEKVRLRSKSRRLGLDLNLWSMLK